MLIALARPMAEAFGRPVCCTLQGEDLFLDGLIEPYRARARELIREQIRYVDRFIAVSDYYAGFMAQIPPDSCRSRLGRALGINTAGFERRTTSDGVFRVGYFARLAPEKGLHVLADAFQRLRQRTGGARIRLEVAGYLAPGHKAYLADVERSLERAGLAGDFAYRGAVDRDGKLAFLRDLDVLSVPATYDEPKGIFLLEAMASGVPVVQPRRGGFTEIVERTGGGLLVEPDDVESLTEGLHTLWHDPALRATLARQGYDGVRAQYTVQRSADRVLAVYDEVIRAKGSPGANAVSNQSAAVR